MEAWIEQLARAKPFEKLSATEQATVLLHLSQEAYTQLRDLLLLAPGIDAGPPPPPALRQRLLNHFARHTAPSRTRLLHRRIPAWQAAVFAGVLAAGVWWLKPKPVPVCPVAEQRVRVDTVFRERIIWKERKVRARAAAAPVAALGEPHLRSEMVAADSLLHNDRPLPATPGTPLSDNPDLIDFFVEIK